MAREKIERSVGQNKPSRTNLESPNLEHLQQFSSREAATVIKNHVLEIISGRES